MNREVIDQEYEVSVADQFVAVDNDALFKCKFAPQVRDFHQVTGWLEDGQPIQQAPAAAALTPASVMSQTHTVSANGVGNNHHHQLVASSGGANIRRRQPPLLTQHQQQQQQQQRAMVLPGGQLLVLRAQLRDANKSYRCQYKNLLNGRIGSSSISGRLFVAEPNESGSMARIVEPPPAISVGSSLNEPLLITCLAQGAPRPQIRWFRQESQATSATSNNKRQSTTNDNDNNGGGGDWLEIGTHTNTTATNNGDEQQQRYALINEGSSLLLKALQASDDGARIKCLASNSFGHHQAHTELRLAAVAAARASEPLQIEFEPQVAYIQEQPRQQSALALNCTITRSNPLEPLIGLEWLRNSRLLFSVSLANSASQSRLRDFYVQSPAGDHPQRSQESAANGTFGTLQMEQQQVSIFDDPNAELIAVDFLATGPLAARAHNSANNAHPNEVSPDSISLAAVPQWRQELPNDGGGQLTPINALSVVTSFSKLAAAATNIEYRPSGGAQQQQHHQQWAWQALKLINRDTLLYQLHLSAAAARNLRGAYQCRARLPRTTHQATSHLLLKDNPPAFVETFPSGQLITKQQQQQPQQQMQVSLKCVASGSPLPEISWTLSGFPVPESSRFRVGDYVTRDGLIVSFVNISAPQPEDGGLYECSASNDVGHLRHSGWLNVSGPVNVRPMPNVSAVAGHSLAIMCPVGGWPVEQINWFQNSSKLPVNHRQKLFPNGTLLINELNEVTDSGHYFCQAKSSPSEAFFAQPPLSGTSSAPTSISTSSSSDGGGGGGLGDSRPRAAQVTPSQATGEVHVTIKVPPVVEPFAFAKSLHRGQRYNVMCTVVRGDSPVVIRWFRDGRPLENLVGAHSAAASQASGEQQQATSAAAAAAASEQQVAVGSGPLEQTIAVRQLDPYSSTLTFTSLQSHHRGVYSCEAQNEAGRANQSSTLVIHVPPEWRIEPKDMSVTVGRTAVIDCQADGFPAARIEWRLSQDLFRETPNEFKPIISSLYMRVFENGSLIIYNAQRTDAGFYLCQANNGVGPGISRVIKLTVHVAAHFKSKIRTELVRRGQSARLRCESIGDPPLEINWLKDKLPLYVADEPRYSLIKSQLQDGLVSELNIIECDRQDSALFTCITQNNFGTDDTNIQLIVQGPPEAPQDIRLTDSGPRSVRLTWTPGYAANSPLTKYLLTYAPLQQSTQQQQPVNNLTIGGNETSLLLQGLTPLTEYYLQLQAVNQLGVSRLPQEPIKFATHDEAPALPAQFVKAQALSSRSIKVRWLPPERRAHYGATTGFYVGYKPVANVRRAAGVSAPAASNQQQNSGAPAVVTTDSTAPTGATSATSSETFVYKTIELSPRHDYGRQSSGNLVAQQQQQQVANDTQLQQECVLSGLRRGAQYLVTVQPFNERGAGPASEPVVAETWRVDVPEPPSLRMVARTTHSIHLAWRLQTGGGSGGSELTRHASAASLRRLSAPGKLLGGGGGGSEQIHANSEQQVVAADPEERAAEEAQANEPILGFILTRRQLQQPPPSQQVAAAAAARAVGQQQQLQQVAASGDQRAVELRLPADHLSHLADNLTCGTRYQFTIVALNSVGPSASSEPLIVKTEGTTPVAPDRSSLLSLNSTSSVAINLGAWHNGACAMRSFDIAFKPSRAKKWTTLTSNYQLTTGVAGSDSSGGGAPLAQSSHEQLAAGHDSPSPSGEQAAGSPTTLTGSHQQQRPPVSVNNSHSNLLVAPSSSAMSTVILDDLSSSLNYDLKIVATNEAGATEALYTFSTGSGIAITGGVGDLEAQWQAGEFVHLDELLGSSFGWSALLPLLLMVLFLLLSLSTGCILFARRRHGSGSSCSLSISSANGTTTATGTTAANGTSTCAGSRTHNGHTYYAAPSGDLASSARVSATLLRLRNGGKSEQQASNLQLNDGCATPSGNIEGSPPLDTPLLMSGGGSGPEAHIRLSELYGSNSAAAAATMRHQHHNMMGGRVMMGPASKSSSGYATYSHSRQQATIATGASESPPPLLHETATAATDLSSVLNGGSEAEMCLGASALNHNHHHHNHHHLHHQHSIGDQQLANDSNNKMGYYMAPSALFLPHQQQQQQQQQCQVLKSPLNSVGQLGKSSTLPANCNQQLMMQQLLQQQQQSHEQSIAAAPPGGQLWDSIVAANLLQQQQHSNATDAYLQAALQQQPQYGSLDQQQQQQHHHQHHHHQVYATVKRCPQLPRLCDYGIYQCPSLAQQQQQQQQQQVVEQQQQQQQTDCCPSGEQVFCHDGQTNENGPMGGACNIGQQQSAQEQISDYQQLRPLN